MKVMQEKTTTGEEKRRKHEWVTVWKIFSFSILFASKWVVFVCRSSSLPYHCRRHYHQPASKPDDDDDDDDNEPKHIFIIKITTKAPWPNKQKMNANQNQSVFIPLSLALNEIVTDKWFVMMFFIISHLNSEVNRFHRLYRGGNRSMDPNNLS